MYLFPFIIYAVVWAFLFGDFSKSNPEAYYIRLMNEISFVWYAIQNIAFQHKISETKDDYIRPGDSDHKELCDETW